MVNWALLPGATHAVMDSVIDGATVTSSARVVSSRGEVLGTVDPSKQLTTFSYGPFGHLTKKSFLGVDSTFVSDELGRPTKVTDPSVGTQEYVLDGLGLVQEYRRNGVLTSYDYDGLGRLTHAVTPDGTYDWVFDGDGTDPSQALRLIRESITSATAGTSSTTYEYHQPANALSKVSRTIEGETFETTVYADNYGRLSGYRFATTIPASGPPRSEGINYLYNDYGRVISVTDNEGATHWKLLQTDAFGSDAVTEVYGGTAGQLKVTRAAEPATGLLAALSVQAPSGALHHFEMYGYDARGLLTSRRDMLANTSQTYAYDAHGRLDFEVVGGVTRDYAYDAHGNLKKKPGLDELRYETATRPYQVTSTSQGAKFTYDPLAGTRTLRDSQSAPDTRQEIKYTAFDLPTEIKAGPQAQPNVVANYKYDASNTRTFEDVATRQNDGKMAHTKTVYAGDLFRRIESAAGMEQVIRVPTPAGISAEISIGPDGRRRVRTIQGDLLGSTSKVFENGAAVEGRSYDAFGKETKTGADTGIRAGFTGHEQDGAIGLINMRGRMYDPLTGRFLSPDPIVQAPLNSQSWNSYSYVMNSPLNFVDPSGFQAMPPADPPPAPPADDEDSCKECKVITDNTTVDPNGNVSGVIWYDCNGNSAIGNPLDPMGGSGGLLVPPADPTAGMSGVMVTSNPIDAINALSSTIAEWSPFDEQAYQQMRAERDKQARPTMTELDAIVKGTPDAAGLLWLLQASALPTGGLVPVNGKINVGGGLEPGARSATNLNPIVPGTGGPTSGIPNHVPASFEQIGEVFRPGSATQIFSNRLPFTTVNWPVAAQGAFKAMAPGGRLSLNIWTRSSAEVEAAVRAFQSAGFREVQSFGSGSGTMILGVK